MTAPVKEIALATVNETQVKRLDQLAKQAGGVAKVGEGPFSELFGLSNVVVELRSALTPQVMAPIMALQGKAIGFRTDKDLKKRDSGRGYEPGPGYDEETVKDVVIEAMTHGARLVMNEVNIIAGRCYLTKEFFARKLTEELGEGNWEFEHGIPRAQAGGALIKTTIRWRRRVQDDWNSFDAEFPIKGDSYSSADQYLGKADRKAGARLYSRVFGLQAPDGDAGDEIEVKAKTVEAPAESILETPTAAPEAPKKDAKLMGEYREVITKAIELSSSERVREVLVESCMISANGRTTDADAVSMRKVVDHADRFIARCVGEEEL